MCKTHLLAAFALVLGVQSAAWNPPAAAQAPGVFIPQLRTSRVGAAPVGGLRVANLRQRLEAGLKARLPQDFAFIDYVVGLVEVGTLPQELVDSTFYWVRKKRWYKRYMVPYFAEALRLRAAQRGIRVRGPKLQSARP